MSFAIDTKVDLDRFANFDVHKATQSLMSIAEEVVTEQEFINLLTSCSWVPRCYDGFEPSGRMHIAQGLMKALYVRKMLDAGCEVVLLLADWFANSTTRWEEI